jgi:hypothetical protein
MWRRTIFDPVYRQGLELLVGGTLEDLERRIRRLTGRPYEHKRPAPFATTIQWTATDGHVGHWMWLHAWNGSPEHIADLVHESFHHVKNVMALVNCQDEEAQAYYQAFLVRRALELLKGYRKGRS